MTYRPAIELAVSAVLVAMVYVQFRILVAPAAMPEFDPDAYWGAVSPDNQRTVDTETHLMEIRYSPEPIQALRDQLNQTLSVQPPLPRANFKYGFNTGFLPEFVTYWRDEYLNYWPSREVLFNRMPHFQTNIQG